MVDILYEPGFLFDDPFLALRLFDFFCTPDLLSVESLDVIENESSCWLFTGEVNTLGAGEVWRRGVPRKKSEGVGWITNIKR